jgi:hypothetical protein
VDSKTGEAVKSLIKNLNDTDICERNAIGVYEVKCAIEQINIAIRLSINKFSEGEFSVNSSEVLVIFGYLNELLKRIQGLEHLMISLDEQCKRRLKAIGY